jgi:hypothetical protein
MNKKAEQLYQSMLTDLLYCQQKGMNQQKEIECCFQISNKYWALLKNEVANYVFKNAADEIEFFKRLKPSFISEIEYYSLLYHAQLFKESTNELCKQEQFWKREAERLEKFKKENRDFYRYYKKGDTKNDKKWFLRANNDLSNFRMANAYDLDVNANTSHDYLVAKLIALKKYLDYVNKELEGIKTD